jgi:gliding motility-associated-like protein
MKRLILFLIITCIPSILICQEWQYSSVINGTSIEPKYSTVDLQGNMYILSQFSGSLISPIVTSYGISDLILFKISPSGSVLWYDQIGSKQSDIAGGITVFDGFLYVTGTFYDTCIFKSTNRIINTGNGDIFIAKYDLNGNFQFAKRVGYSSTLQSSTHLKVDNNERLVMTGFFKDSLIIGSTPADLDTLRGSGTTTANFISTFDLEGNHIWSKRFLGTNNLSRFLRIGISENGYYFGGYFQGNLTFDMGTISSYDPATYDAFLYKTDFNGNGEWVRRIRGLKTENFRTLTTDEYDNAYVLGNYNSATIYVDSTEALTKSYAKSAGTSYDTYMAKYNRSGILQWFLIKGGTGKDIYNDFVIRNNIIYATGYFAKEIIFSNDTLRTDTIANEDAFLAAFNQIGDPISGISIKGTGNYNDAGSLVRMDANSRAYVAGYFKSQQIKIGEQTYTSSDVNASDQFFAVYKQAFKAIITDEKMVSCFGKSDGMLTVTPYFGRPPYTYSWSHNTNLNSPTATDLAAGFYAVTITDNNDSVTLVTGEVKQSADLSITGLITPVSCYNEEDGAIDITVTGGTKVTDYEYFWTSVDGSGIIPLNQDQTGITHGTYTVAVRDINNCSDTADFLVTEPSRIEFKGTQVTSIIKPIISGRYGAVNLSVTGGNNSYNFAWTGPDGFAATSEDIANLDSSGIYSVHITDSKNCPADTAITVIDNFTFVAQIKFKTDVLCFGANNGTATVSVNNGTPPYSYQWSDGPTLSDSVRTGMQPDNYIVTVTDASAKTAQAFVTISSPASALSLISVPHDLFCNGDNSGVIDLTVTGGTLPYGYSWNNGYEGEDLVNVAAGVYTVEVTDANGCTVQDTKEIKEPADIGLSASVTRDLKCYGDNDAIATAIATGGTPPGTFSYLWDDPGTQITPIASDLEAGHYTVTVTDSNGCSKSTAVEVTAPDQLVLDNLILVNPSCPGLSDGSIVPTFTGGTGTGYEYIWSNLVFVRLNTDIPAGSYILKMNDANNCVVEDTFNLVDPDTLRINSVNITDVSCLGKTDGALAINASGGTGSLEYSINDGATYGNESDIINLSAGNYITRVRDDENCPAESYPVTISIADTVVIDSVTVTDATCLGINDGILEIYASGGTGNYEYSIDGGENFGILPAISSLSAGVYTALAKDDNDCVSEDLEAEIINLDTVRYISVTPTDLTCAGADGSITISAAGGTRDYEYSVDGGDVFTADSVFDALQQGDYIVVVRDANECLSEERNITLHATETCGLIIYDAISPNGDGKNDVWHIGNAGPNIKVKIFNIWGKMVFSSSGYGDPWDGKYEGKDLPAGTYYYVIEPGDGTDNITGAVSIVK